MIDQPPSSSARLSVALCTYNGARFLKDQLDSIASQSRPVDEIVICDDGSSDATAQVVETFAATSPMPVSFQINGRRLGVTGNFEKAISRCRGEIILLSDQDDLWHRDKTRRLMESLADESVGLAFSNAEVVHEDLSPAGYRLWESVWFDAGEQNRLRRDGALPVLLRHAIAAGSTLAFRAKYLPLIMPIPDFPHSHDIWIALLIACVGRLAAVDEDLVKYRLHDANHVGLRRYNLLGQIRMARQQIRGNAFLYAADLHAAALRRLSESQPDAWPVAEANLKLLEEKVRHSRLRHRLPANWFSRLGVIGEEIRRGNYAKYSYGYKSVLQDLILR